ncbi:MAG: 7TM domain-containing protein [Patescibacteria group bacterium]
MDVNEFSPIIQFLLEQQLDLNTITLLLLFPIVITIVVILRQIIGIQSFGIYTPSIITIAFVFIAQDSFWDIKYAIAIYAIVLCVGMGMRYVLKKLRLLYLPRVAINLTVVSFSMLFVLGFAGYFGRTGFASTAIFPIIVIIMLVEKFVAVQIEKGSRTAIVLAAETLVIALIGYTILSPTTEIGRYMISLVLVHPLTILLIIPINLFIGKWTGLRVNEYLRFQEVINKIK